MKKNILIILVFLVIATVISWSSFFGQYVGKDTIDVHAFPRTVGEWSSREVPISAHDYEILETHNVFSRIYQDPEGHQIMLLIIYSQNNRKVSHPPEICYTGSGATILNNTLINFNLGTAGKLGVKRLTAQEGRYREMIYYWFKVGNDFTASYWKQQALVAFRALLGQPVSSAMIRLSMGFEGTDARMTDAKARSFARLIYPKVKEYLP